MNEVNRLKSELDDKNKEINALKKINERMYKMLVRLSNVNKFNQLLKRQIYELQYKIEKNTSNKT